MLGVVYFLMLHSATIFSGYLALDYLIHSCKFVTKTALYQFPLFLFKCPSQQPSKVGTVAKNVSVLFLRALPTVVVGMTFPVLGSPTAISSVSSVLSISIYDLFLMFSSIGEKNYILVLPICLK